MNQSKNNSNENAPCGERGYALIALIGVMMFALILTTAAAPQVKKETQREREEEMLWRGEQIASAIARYFRDQGGRWPLGREGIKQLADGVQVMNQLGGKKKKYLRKSALCDPMTPCGSDVINWRLVRPGDPLAKELYEAYNALLLKAQSEGTPMRQPEMLAQLDLMARAAGFKLPGDAGTTTGDAGATGGQGNPQDPTPNPNPDSVDGLKDVTPVIGVVSTKSDRMFRSYYGIVEYDHALFFPTIPVQAGGFIPLLSLAGSGFSTTTLTLPRAQDGCIYIGGVPSGCLREGICSPPKRINPQTGQCEEPPPPPTPTPTPTPRQ